MSKLISLMRDIYDPFVHSYFALNWSLSFFLLWRGQAFSFHDLFHHWPVIVISSLILFFVLFYLRLVDEIKDYEYDVVFNPSRPLVSGKSRIRDFILISIGCLVISLLLAKYLGSYALYFLLFHFLYSFLLWPLESALPWLKKSMSLNLIFTYPVNVSLSVFLLLNYSTAFASELSFSAKNVGAVCVFATSFLYYEFSRKIDFHSDENQRLYSHELGLGLSLLFNLTWSVLTAYGLFLLLETWFSLVLFLPVLWGFVRYKKRKPYPFKVTGGAFLGLFYGLIIAVQLIRAF